MGLGVEGIEHARARPRTGVYIVVLAVSIITGNVVEAMSKFGGGVEGVWLDRVARVSHDTLVCDELGDSKTQASSACG